MPRAFSIPLTYLRRLLAIRFSTLETLNPKTRNPLLVSYWGPLDALGGYIGGIE